MRSHGLRARRASARSRSTPIFGRASLSQPDDEDRPRERPAPTRRMSEGQVFNEPWEAEALALSVSLQQAGHFTATEWSAALGAEIKAAQALGDPDDGTTYYRHVLAALERVLVVPEHLVERGEVGHRVVADLFNR